MSAAPPTYILDSNLLIRLADKSSPLRPTASNAVMALIAAGAILRTVPQSLFEFWVVATRPTDKNGLGLSVTDTESELASFLRSFPVLPDDPALMLYWRRLVVQYHAVGKHAHDVRYIAAMQAQGLMHFFTFDSDFNRYRAEGITIVHPAGVPAASTGD